MVKKYKNRQKHEQKVHSFFPPNILSWSLIVSHGQTYDSLCEWICFKYASGVKPIHAMSWMGDTGRFRMWWVYWGVPIQPTCALVVSAAIQPNRKPSFLWLVVYTSSCMQRQLCLHRLALPPKMKHLSKGTRLILGFASLISLAVPR